MAATSVTRLREALGALLQFYPLVLRNVFQSPTPSSTADASHADASPPTHGVASHYANHMADAVEGFLSELTRVLSVGLGKGDGFELWSVLELLECVPDRMQAVAEAEASPAMHRRTRSPAATAGNVSAFTSYTPLHQQRTTPLRLASSGSAQRGGPPSSSSPPLRGTAHLAEQGSPAANTWQRHLSRFRFASQLVYVVRSGFPAAPRSLQARILLRLTLNQGCLLAALELLRQWCRMELEGFYSCASGEGALLTQSSTDSDLWNAFVAAIAPVAGPPVVEIAAGAPKTAAHAFHLQLVVAGLDDDSAASRAYYAQLQSYAQGRRGTRPSALACYEATLQRRANGPVTMSVEPAAAEAVSRPKRRAAAPPARQYALTVEALPVTKEGWAAAARSERGGGGSVPSSASVNTHSSSVSGQQQWQRHCRRRKRRSRVPAGEGEAAEEDVAADRSSSHQPRSRSSTSYASHHHHLPTQTHPRALSSSSTSTSASSSRSLAPAQVPPQSEGIPPASRHLFEVNGGAAAAVLPDGAHDAAMETAAVFSSYAMPDVAASAPGVPRSFSTAGDGHQRDSGVKSTALPPELQDLQRRVLRCWSVAVKHAESQERKCLSARDADANDVAGA